MTYLRTGLISLSVALALLGCGDLWRPFLIPMSDTSPSCRAGAACDLAGGPSGHDGGSGDGMTTPLPPVWLNESRPILANLMSVSMVKTGLAYAVGESGTIVQWTQTPGWVVQASSVAAPTYMSVVGNSASNIWIAAANGTVYQYDGIKTVNVNSPCMPCDTSFQSIWMTPVGVPWVAGLTNKAYRIPDGSQSWGFFDIPNSVGQNLYAVWGINSTDVWFGSGDGSAGPQLFHYNGANIQSYKAPDGTAINGIWGRTTKDVWAVGELGVILHWTGGSGWQQVIVPAAGTVNLHAITGNSAGELWAVGDNGLILYYNGTAWQQATSGVQQPLYGVTVSLTDSSPIAVGGKGTILRFAIP